MANQGHPTICTEKILMKYLVTNQKMMAKAPQFVKQKIVTTFCMVGLAPKTLDIAQIVFKKPQCVAYLLQYVHNKASFYL
jgi:hypothetical protein